MVATGNELFLLPDKTVLVTGGTRGIGQAISLRLARAGATVIANYLRNETAAETLRAIAEKENLRIVLCRADLTKDKGLEQVDRSVQGCTSYLSAFVHCAATGVHRPIEELTDKHFDWTMNLNVRAFFDVTKLLLARLSEGSSIVAVSSWGALRAIPNYSLVGSSKGALEALARHFAAELASRGIRVNVLVAGAVLTEAWEAVPHAAEQLAETMGRTPIRRLVTPDQVAYGAQFLCSDAAGGMIGQTLVIDGGVGIMV